MILYIDSSIVESEKYATKMKIFFNDCLLIERTLRQAEFTAVEISIKEAGNLRFHFEAIRKGEHMSYSELQTFTYESLVHMYPELSSETIGDELHKRCSEDYFMDFICPVTWNYAYDTVIEDVTIEEEYMVLFFTDSFIYPEIQALDVLSPKNKQERIKLVWSISKDILEYEFIKKKRIFWILCIGIFVGGLLIFASYYGLYALGPARMKHFFTAHFLLFPIFVVQSMLLLGAFLLRISWERMYAVIRRNDELSISKDFRNTI